MSTLQKPIKELDDAFYKTLLESTKAIPWQIDWKTMSFTYVGPQIEELLGWTADSWVSANDWAERMHEEDREFVVNFCVSQSRDGVDHEADYRALKADGGYVWIRDVVHVVRKDGEVDSLVGFMFDISDRKKTEQELVRLQQELEALSYQDGLTGIANRRMFEMVLEREWATARRNARPLSLILLDIDYFKQYNDSYGHIGGDECLRQLATLLSLGTNRAQDLVARYGGEEFALILPNTDSAAASLIAEKCRALVVSAQIPHAQSLVAPHLTISQGVGTLIPTEHNNPTDFIDAVDKMLYQAKRQGRNRVVPLAVDVPT